MQSDGNRLCCPQIWRNKKEGKGAPPEARWSVTAMICGAWLPCALILSVLGWYTEEVASKEFHPFTPFSLHWPFLSVLTSHLRYFSLGNVSGANQASFANPCKPNKKVSKNSENNHERASQLTSSIYKILWSNSSYFKSYKKDKFSDNNNGSNASQICLFCNF